MNVATFGQDYALICAVVASFTSAFMIGVGIWLMKRPITPTNPNPERAGWILIAVAIAALLVSWLWVLLTFHSKTLATVSAASAVVHVI